MTLNELDSLQINKDLQKQVSTLVIQFYKSSRSYFKAPKTGTISASAISGVNNPFA